MKPAAQTYFLDTSTLVHAVDKNTQYHKECLSILTRAAKGQISTATSLETLEEVLFVLSRLTTLQAAISVTRDLLRMAKIKKHEMTRIILEHALEIMETTSLKRPKDAINVATMLEHDIPAIISEDKEYDKVKLVERVHPKDL